MAMACFTVFSFYYFLHWQKETKNSQLVLSGLFAGIAFGCKYLIFALAIFPIAVLIILHFKPRKNAKIPVLIFLGSIVLVFIPWLIKNLILTGNPLFQLFYSLMGGDTWNSFVAAKFSKAHFPDFNIIHLLKLHLSFVYPFDSAPYSWVPLLFLPAFFSNCARHLRL